MKRVYVAGPMTGIPHFNIPAFEAMAASLRYCLDGPQSPAYEPVLPLDIIGGAHRDALLRSTTGSIDDYPSGMTWGDFLSRDVKAISDGGIDLILVLPGWERSRGARLETYVGYLSGCSIVRPEYSWTGQLISLWEIPRSELIRAWEGDNDVKPI